MLYLYYTCTSDVQSVMQGYCTSFHSFYKQSFHHHWVQFLNKKAKTKNSEFNKRYSSAIKLRGLTMFGFWTVYGFTSL